MKSKMQNIIIVDYNKISDQTRKEEVVVSFQNKDTLKLHIQIVKSTTLMIDASLASFFSLTFEVRENVDASVLFFKKGNHNICKESYLLEKNSTLILNKICCMDGNEEMVSVYLNGENANINYVCKTLSIDEEKYNIDIFHRANNTECLLYNHGITHLNGKISFTISNIVPKGMKDTKINQNSQIITMNKEKCVIKPNLFIDENEVEASHSAHIGFFDDSLLFYLKSRGIEERKACNLLLKGFLKQKLFFEEERLAYMIDQYWR